MDSEVAQVEPEAAQTGSEAAQTESEVALAEYEVNPAEISLRKFTQDIWGLIVNHLNGKEVSCLAATAPFIRQMVDLPPVWKITFLRDFGLPDPGNEVVIDWKLFYARAHAKFEVTSIMGETIGWVRIGMFNVESSKALLANVDASTKQATPEHTTANLVGKWTNLVAHHVTSGLWVAYAKVSAPIVPPGGVHPSGMMIELDVRHVNRFLETGIDELVYSDTSMFSPVVSNGFHAAFFDHEHLGEAHDLCSIDNWEVLEWPSSWPGPPLTITSYLAPHCVGVGFTLLAGGLKQALAYDLKKNINVDVGYEHNAFRVRSNLSFTL